MNDLGVSLQLTFALMYTYVAVGFENIMPSMHARQNGLVFPRHETKCDLIMVIFEFDTSSQKKNNAM